MDDAPYIIKQQIKMRTYFSYQSLELLEQECFEQLPEYPFTGSRSGSTEG